MGFHETQWKASEFHGNHWSSIEFHGIPLETHGIACKSKEFHGREEDLLRGQEEHILLGREEDLPLGQDFLPNKETFIFLANKMVIRGQEKDHLLDREEDLLGQVEYLLIGQEEMRRPMLYLVGAVDLYMIWLVPLICHYLAGAADLYII